MVSGMAAASELARRQWDGDVEPVAGDGELVGFAIELTPTAILRVEADGIRVRRGDGTVLHEQAAVRRGTAIEVCGAAASAAVDFWRELESGLGRPEAEARIAEVLGPELGPREDGALLDPALVHLVVRLHRERALKFQRAVWGEAPAPVDPGRPAAGEPVVLAEPAPQAREAFLLALAPEGSADPLWRRAVDEGDEFGRAWRRQHPPSDDAQLGAEAAARARAVFRLPVRRWMVAAWSTVVVVPVGVFGIVMASLGIADAGPSAVLAAVLIGLALFALLLTLILLLYRSALHQFRLRRDEQRWAVQVMVHRAREAARTWRTSRVRWSARDLE